MMTIEAAPDATEIDVDGLIDETTGIRYVGKATKTFGGRWLCLANVGGLLCRVELSINPSVHIDTDPGDEDDRWGRDMRIERDLGTRIR